MSRAVSVIVGEKTVNLDINGVHVAGRITWLGPARNCLKAYVSKRVIVARYAKVPSVIRHWLPSCNSRHGCHGPKRTVIRKIVVVGCSASALLNYRYYEMDI